MGKMWIEVNRKYISFWVPMSVILSANYNDTLVVDHLFWVKMYFSSYDLKRHLDKVVIDEKLATLE